MVEVTLKEGETLERALRRFKKKWERAGILRDVKKNAFYEKPSTEKRVARKKALRRMARMRRLARY